MCNSSKEKCFLFLFHSLTLSLCFSLFLHTDCTSSNWSSHLCFALSGTHTQWPRMALCFSSAHKAEWPLFFFFSSLSVSGCLTRLSHCPRKWHADFGTLLIKRSQTSPCFGHFSINGKNLLWRLLEQAYEWALTMHVGWTHMVRHPTISPSNPLRRRSSTQVFNQSSCRPTRHKALASLLTQLWFTCQLNFHLCESSLIQMTVVQ